MTRYGWQGAYTPGTNRSDTFQMKDGVDMYGGFTNGMVSLDARDWAKYVTTLSGEIQEDAESTNNSYHVVKGADNALLDGFTITNGYADGTDPDNYGGGMYNSSASPVITNCTFSGNSAAAGGGRINMGRYGNTAQASKFALLPRGTVFMAR